MSISNGRRVGYRSGTDRIEGRGGHEGGGGHERG